MFRRNVISDISSALKDSPVVVLNGARQVGKSTLAATLIAEHFQCHMESWPDFDILASLDSPQYYTLDDATLLSAATASPLSFLEKLPPHAVIDEIQRAPELFLAVKQLVDRDRKPGRFLLTGSANVLTLPKLADSLAGRMEIHTLWPLSQGEIEGTNEAFIDACFASRTLPNISAKGWSDLTTRIAAGGYPEALQRTEERRRNAWYRSYLTSIIERDIRDLARIEGYRELPNLLQLLAARAGGLLNFSDISRALRLSNSTLKRYMALLEAVFLFVPLPAWHKNEGKRLVKSPKCYLNDTGLLMHLRGMERARLHYHAEAGGILENFVVMELRKQQAWSDTLPALYHFRTSGGKEVDIVLEAPDGRIVGIEVKSHGEAGERDFSGLKELAELAGPRFYRGIVLYGGYSTVHFGKNMTAMPISALWQIAKKES